MMPALRRILVTALLGALVGLGAFLALLGRRPRKPVTASVQVRVPVTVPSGEGGTAKHSRSFAVGLVVLLLLTGLTGILYESRDTLFGPRSPATGGDGQPLAALSPSTSGSGVAGEPAPRSGTTAGSVPTPEPGGQASPSPGASAASTAPGFDIVRVEPNGTAVVSGRASPNATIELLVDGKPSATAQADGSGRFTVTPPALPSGSSEIGLRSTDAQGGTQRSPAHVAVVIAPSRDTEPLVALIAPDQPTVILSQPDRLAGSHRGLGAEPDRQARLGAGDAPARQSLRLSGQNAANPEAALRGSDADDRSATGAQAGSSGQGSTQSDSDSAESGSAKSGSGGAMLQPAPGNAAGVLKPADGPVIAATTPTQIISIHAQDGGKLFVTARATAGADLRLYLNDTIIAPATVGRDGTVTFVIGRGVRPGAYRVRLDRVDPATGKVRDRAEVPFSAPASGHDEGVEYATAQQEATGAVVGSDASAGQAPRNDAVSHDPAAKAQNPRQRSGIGDLAAHSPATAGSGASAVYIPGIETARIERGDSLWKVSRRTYGEGDRYTLIYDANQDQIRDPDLIYPGQVFVLPSRDISGADGGGK